MDEISDYRSFIMFCEMNQQILLPQTIDRYQNPAIPIFVDNFFDFFQGFFFLPELENGVAESVIKNQFINRDRAIF